MGEGHPRHTKRSVHREPPRQPTDRTGPPAQATSASPPRPAGTTPPATRRATAARTPVVARPSTVQKLADLPLSSRTTTLDDPLTTSLLAEVTRRSRTVDVSPEEIDEAKGLAPDDRDPDDSI